MPVFLNSCFDLAILDISIFEPVARHSRFDLVIFTPIAHNLHLDRIFKAGARHSYQELPNFEPDACHSRFHSWSFLLGTFEFYACSLLFFLILRDFCANSP